jgi:hypothetical protein
VILHRLAGAEDDDGRVGVLHQLDRVRRFEYRWTVDQHDLEGLLGFGDQLLHCLGVRHAAGPLDPGGTGPEDGEVRVERARLDALGHGTAPGHDLLEAVGLRAAREEEAGEGALGGIGVHRQNRRPALGDRERDVGHDRTPIGAGVRRDEDDGQPVVAGGAQALDRPRGEPERLGSRRLRIGCHRQRVGGGRRGGPDPVAPARRDVPDEGRVIDRGWVEPAVEAPPAAGPQVGQSGTQDEPDHQPDGAGPLRVAVDRHLRFGRPDDARMGGEVQLQVDQGLRPLVLQVGELAFGPGVVDGSLDRGQVGRTLRGDRGGSCVVERLERRVGTGPGHPGVRPGEGEGDDAGAEAARRGLLRRGDLQRRAVAREVVLGQHVVVQRRVGDGGRAIGHLLGLQQQHLAVEVLGAGLALGQRALRHRDRGVRAVKLRLPH